MQIEVYKAINAIQLALSKVGISKDQKNTTQNFKFRGIDDVMNSLSPLLAQHSLCILPHVLNREITERISSKGGALLYVVVEIDYAFISAIDGSNHTVRVYGEAMDSGDKATNKAMSAAYKYAAIQTFCIPTEGEDADAATHEVKAEPKLSALYNQLVELIIGLGLEPKIPGWLAHFKVANLSELSDEDITKLINRIKESN